MSIGMTLIGTERFKQLSKGYSIEHDDAEHTVEELMRISACYADFAATYAEGDVMEGEHPFWPNTTIPWNPRDTTSENMILSAAFAAAAIDLLYFKGNQPDG